MSDTQIDTAAELLGGVRIPALKGRQGDRDMYLLSVKNNALLRNFSADAEPTDDKDQKAQRSLDPRHASDIVTYITENAQDYVLGAVTYATDLVDPAQHFKELVPGSGIGVLLLPLDAKLRCLDGQHRRAAIKEAAEIDDEILEDSTAVVLYVEDDYIKRRQMFSDMNSTPKVVAKALNVSFDTRDPYAQAAIALADSHPMLKDVVEKEKARITSKSPNIFSLAGVYDGLKRYVLGTTLPRGRSPRDKEVSELTAAGTELFDVLQAARPEYAETRTIAQAHDGTATADKVIGSMMTEQRKKTLLLSTTTLRVIAGALHVAMKRDGKTDPMAYKDSLSAVDFTPKSKLFLNAGFIGPNGTPSARNQEVLAATQALANALKAN